MNETLKAISRLVEEGTPELRVAAAQILGESRVRRIPEHFALVVRTLILLNGLSHRLAPGRRLIQAFL